MVVVFPELSNPIVSMRSSFCSCLMLCKIDKKPIKVVRKMNTRIHICGEDGLISLQNECAVEFIIRRLNRDREAVLRHAHDASRDVHRRKRSIRVLPERNGL